MNDTWDVVHLPVLKAAAKRVENGQAIIRAADLKADIPEISLGSLKAAITALGSVKGRALLQTDYELAGEYISGITPDGWDVIDEQPQG